MIGAPPQAATDTYAADLDRIRRLVGLRVQTLALAVVDPDDAVGWARLTALGTDATVVAQQAAKDATAAYAMATLEAAGAPLEPVNVPIQPGYLGSGRDVQGLFSSTSRVVQGRTAAGATFPEALAASAQYLVGVASSEPHRIGRDGLLATGLSDSRFERYRRVAVGATCDFCLMLATRGAVYLSAESAGQSRKYHVRCDCRIELVVGADAITRSTELQGDWRNASRDEQRLIDAGAMDGVTSDAREWLETGGWAPGRWQAASAEDALDDVVARLPEDVAAKVRQTYDIAGIQPTRAVARYTNGNKTVILETDVPEDQIKGLLDDFDEAIAALPPSTRPRSIELMTTANDPSWDGDVGGYVIKGAPRIHLNPRIASGAERWTDTGGFHPPAFTKARTRRDVIMHEMGHVVDHSNGHLPKGPAFGTTDDEYNFWRDVFLGQDWEYAKQSPAEGYAEAFFQYHVGGAGSSPVSDAYAARFGWN